MFFSTNKRGIIKNTTNQEINKDTIFDKNTDTDKNVVNTTIYLLRYGMFARLQNTSNCSSCGK